MFLFIAVFLCFPVSIFLFYFRNYRYFQSLVDTQKKEMEELRIKVEDLCTKLLMQEETKMNITKQLHYWRYKASSLEVIVFIFCAYRNENDLA